MVVMKVRRLPPREEVEVIKIKCDETNTLIDNPVRNLKCPRGKTCCVWPMAHILELLHSRQEPIHQSLGNETLICEMCRN